MNDFLTQRKLFGPLCAGIDPSAQTLIELGFKNDSSGLESFTNEILEALKGKVGFIKPQVAFFERFGSAGFLVLERLISDARAHGLYVIADAKRGDIGSTMDAYGETWLSEESPLSSNALTVSPFVGLGSLQSTIDLAAKQQKTVFVLCSTSNPDAAQFQSALNDSKTVTKQIAEAALAYEFRPSTFGLVVGATRSLKSIGLEPSRLARVPILAPGFGFQGAELSNGRTLFGAAWDSTVASVSRSLVAEGISVLPKTIDSHLLQIAQAERAG